MAHFWLFWLVLDRFASSCVGLGLVLGCFRLFWVVLACFWSLWLVLDHFGAIFGLLLGRFELFR